MSTSISMICLYELLPGAEFSSGLDNSSLCLVKLADDYKIGYGNRDTFTITETYASYYRATPQEMAVITQVHESITTFHNNQFKIWTKKEI